MTYEQAKQKALSIDNKIDTMQEYESVYVFYNSKSRGAEAIDREIVIYKQDGKITNYTEYIDTTKDNTNKPIRKIYQPEGLK